MFLIATGLHNANLPRCTYEMRSRLGVATWRWGGQGGHLFNLLIEMPVLRFFDPPNHKSNFCLPLPTHWSAPIATSGPANRTWVMQLGQPRQTAYPRVQSLSTGASRRRWALISQPQTGLGWPTPRARRNGPGPSWRPHTVRAEWMRTPCTVDW